MLDCAIREVKEETGFTVFNLKYCGIVHWTYDYNDNRYICFMYKTNNFEGELISKNREGDHFWLKKEELFKLNNFSNPHYALSPLFHEYVKYNEVFILVKNNYSEFEVSYK